MNIITVASWEERFLRGFEYAVNKYQPNSVLIYYYKEYQKWSINNIRKAMNLCAQHGIENQSCELSFKEHIKSWNILFNDLNGSQIDGGSVLLDLTTMPREVIWTSLDILDSRGIKIHYLYSEPERYNNKWLSRDPGSPRLVYKLSGEPKLGNPTKLLILTGYDVDRVKQIIRFFEPQHTILGLQKGEQLSNQELNVSKYKRKFDKNKRAIELFDIDAYESDHGFDAINKILELHARNANIIMSSLGPKLSAVSLYKLHKKYPQTSLAYAPSNEYNRRYSYGIGRIHEGEM